MFPSLTTDSLAASEFSQARLRADAGRLSLAERCALGIGIFEIPLQIDKYFGFQESHAELGAVAGLNVSVTSVAFAFLYLMWWADSSLGRGTRRQLQIGLPMICYLSLVTLSVFAAEVRFLAVCDLFNVLQAYLLFFYLANRITARDDLVFCVGCLALAMTCQSLLIIGLKAIGASAVGQAYTLGPLVLSVWDDGRPAGSMHSAVLAGSLLSLIWLPVMAIAVADFPARVKRWALPAVAVGLAGILLTQTRGAIATTILGTAVLFGCLMGRSWLGRRTILVGLVLAALSIVPLAKVVQKRALAGDNGSAASRKHLAAIGLAAIADKPVLGYGAGNCHLACAPYANSAEYRGEWYYTIHCKYLLVWIENGVFGLIAFLFVLSNGMLQGIRTWWRRDRQLSPLGLAIAAAIAGHMIHMLVDVFNSRSQVQMLWVVLGIGAALWRLSRNAPRVPSGQVGRGGVAYVR